MASYQRHMYELLVWLLGTCLGISISICIFNNCQLWRTHCSTAPAREICICKSVTRVRNICLHNDKLTLMPSKPPPTTRKSNINISSNSYSNINNYGYNSNLAKFVHMHFVWLLFAPDGPVCPLSSRCSLHVHGPPNAKPKPERRPELNISSFLWATPFPQQSGWK
ncbi:uncharacterized protein LOC108139169 [Drosophila elegans]|uniref:uncharacterized protein LOC108139169 n=1 Tax=Drosophila elegans TaxID=30023 RepID=UPI0007E69202|nr:uncharacterized protein LOC108139169 [Drosophila elegans]